MLDSRDFEEREEKRLFFYGKGEENFLVENH